MKTTNKQHILYLVITLLSLIISTPVAAHNDGVMHNPAISDGVVRIIFFYSPDCPHCRNVTTTVLPELREQYEDQLQILELNTRDPLGRALFSATVEAYGAIVEQRYGGGPVGWPMAVIDDQMLMGDRDIIRELPQLVAVAYENGGTAWPNLTGIQEALENADLNTTTSEKKITLIERVNQDQPGNTISIFLLVGLLVTLGLVIQPRSWHPTLANRARAIGFPIVLIIGFIASGYLSYVEVTQSDIVCGPVGHCDVVQQYPLATLFGFLPLAVVGFLGYVAIAISQLIASQEGNRWQEPAAALTFLLSLFGLGASTVLTFLEPFVIGATCAWCLTSAVCMACLALLSAGDGWRVLKKHLTR